MNTVIKEMAWERYLGDRLASQRTRLVWRRGQRKWTIEGKILLPWRTVCVNLHPDCAGEMGRKTILLLASFILTSENQELGSLLVYTQSRIPFNKLREFRNNCILYPEDSSQRTRWETRLIAHTSTFSLQFSPWDLGVHACSSPFCQHQSPWLISSPSLRLTVNILLANINLKNEERK